MDIYNELLKSENQKGYILPDDVKDTTELDLNNFGLMHIPNSIIKLKKLEFLNLNNNKLTYLPNLPKSLRLLYCDHNKIKGIPASNIEELHCSYNNLLYLSNDMPNLEILECYGHPSLIIPSDICDNIRR